MEEKKMTDEEIVNALDKTKQELANINPEDDDYDKLLAVKKIVDYCHYLIRRLQSENEQLRNAKTIYESVDYCADDLAKALKTIDEQQAEIERLTRELDELFDRHAKENQAASLLIEKRNNEIAELQKQVDELKAENTELYKEHTTLIAGSILQKKQAVKDTAKEILQTIMSIIKKSNGFLAEEVVRILAKQNGVEVE